MMNSVTLVLECGHRRRIALDTSGRNGTPERQAAQIARAFLEPCRMCAAIEEANIQNDRMENLEAFRVTDKRKGDD